MFSSTLLQLAMCLLIWRGIVLFTHEYVSRVVELKVTLRHHHSNKLLGPLFSQLTAQNPVLSSTLQNLLHYFLTPLSPYDVLLYANNSLIVNLKFQNKQKEFLALFLNTIAFHFNIALSTHFKDVRQTTLKNGFRF